MQMKFCHKSNLLICQILSKALTYCKRFNVRRTPINPKEIVEKYEKSNMQILAVKNRNPQQQQDKWHRWQFLKMHSSRFSELAG